MLRIDILRSAHSLQPLRDAWQRLYQPCRHTMFQAHAWNVLAARAFAGSAEPMVIHAESDSGAAIIPACIAGDCVSFLGESLFDYRNVLFSGDTEVLRRAWQQVAMVQRPVRVTAIRGDRARRDWEELEFSPRSFCGAPGVRAADISAEAFAAEHTRSGRLMRRLARSQVQMRCHGDAEESLVRQIYRAKAQQGTAGSLFHDPARVDFMVAIAAEDPGCEIFTLETAGSLVAALVTFRDDSVRRFYTVYFDRAWAHASPGVALVYEVTRRSLEQGLDCDYMTGEQPHKMRFATHLVSLYRVEAQPDELAGICRPIPASRSSRAQMRPAA